MTHRLPDDPQARAEALALAFKDALTGTDSGSDTRAGSLRGGSASGSDIDPDQARINQALAETGAALKRPAPPPVQPQKVRNTGDDAQKQPGDDVDAATG